MAKCVCFVLFGLFVSVAFADDRIVFNEEDERIWNTPPELTSEPVGKSTNGQPQPRFLPFSATFSLNAGSSNAHSLSVGASNDGLSLSQSSSQADSLGAFGLEGQGLSASQSSSFSAGLSGISASDANAFSLNHPAFGGTSQANSNSFSLGEADAQSHGSVQNGHASSGAQSGVGSSATGGGASSGAFSGAGGGHATSGADASAFQSQGHRQGRPIWTNLGPNSQANGNNREGGIWGNGPNRPTVAISGQKHQIWPNGDRPGRQQGHGDGLGFGLNNANWPSRVPHQGDVQLNVHGSNNWLNNNPGHQSNGQNNRRPQNCGHNRQNVGHKSENYYNRNTGCNDGASEQFDKPTWSNHQNQRPGTQISAASASSGSSSTGNGFSFGQSSSQSDFGPNGPSSSTNNHVHSSGNAQGFSQGAAAAVGQTNGQTDASFSSGAISGSSHGNGQSLGTASSWNRGQNSKGQVNSQSSGDGTVHGTANAGSVSFVRFPEESNHNIPKEFIRAQPHSRSDQNGRDKKNGRHPVDAIITEITDSVVDLFDI